MRLLDTKLGDCLSMIENGATIKQIEGAGGYPITRIETLSNDRFNRDRLGYADINNIESYKNHILDNEDLIMSHINSRQFLGRTVIYLKKGNEAIIHGMNVLRIKTKKDVLNPFYAYYYFKTPHFRKAIDNIRTDAINQSSINTNNIKDIKIHIPDLPTQEKVVGILRGIDKKIEENEDMNVELEAMAKQLYDYWFVQFDFPDENGNPYKSSGGKMVYNPTLKREIPAGWEVKGLGDVLVFSNGINYEKGIEGDKEYKIINVRNITSSSVYINKSELDTISLPSKQADNYLIEENDIIIARSGTPGSTRLIDSPIDVIYCGFIIKGSPIDSTYKFYVTFFLKQLEGTQATKTGGSILQNVSQETLKSLNLVLPSKHLFTTFNEKIKALFTLLNKKQDENNELTHLRDSLLPMLMNGQVTVE